jgi:hypothetical protein
MGTFDELVEIVTWAQLGLHAKPVVLANIDGLFRADVRDARSRRAREIRHRLKAGRAGAMAIPSNRLCDCLRKKGLAEREFLDLAEAGPRICALSRKRE